MDIRSLTVLEARNLKARCWQGHAPSEICGGILSHLFLASSVAGTLCQSLACSSITPISAFVIKWHFPVCLSAFTWPSSQKDTSNIGLRAHSTPAGPHLN